LRSLGWLRREKLRNCKGMGFLSSNANAKRMKPIFFILLGGVMALQSCNSDNRNTREVNNEEVNTEQPTPVKMVEYLVGKWKLESVKGGSGNETRDLTLTFTAESRYILHSGNEKIDSGTYQTGEYSNRLFLQSEKTENLNEWDMKVEEERMILTPSQPNTQQGGAEYVYRRSSPASIPPDKRDR
jgi:hypothetical protein